MDIPALVHEVRQWIFDNLTEEQICDRLTVLGILEDQQETILHDALRAAIVAKEEALADVEWLRKLGRLPLP